MRELFRPSALRPGDVVHVISPSGPVIPDNIAAGVELLRSWDLDPIVDDGVYRRRPPFDYLAGDDDHRHRAFVSALEDPRCRAIICTRGGYGAMRWMTRLRPSDLPEDPPLLVGFSDVTALLLDFCGRLGVATLHGPVVKSLARQEHDPESAELLRRALFADDPHPPWTGLQTVRPGQVTAPVYGGNLSLICALLATPSCPDLSGAILIVEDVGEDDYRVDRLLTTLRLAVPDLGGLVLGEFLNCHGVYVTPERSQEYLATLAADFHCPTVLGAPVGHGSVNHAFPLGIKAHLDAAAGTLTFLDHATRP